MALRSSGRLNPGNRYLRTTTDKSGSMRAQSRSSNSHCLSALFASADAIPYLTHSNED